MTPRSAFEADGVVCFTSQPQLSYRYNITADQSVLKIWLENRKSKRQWQTKELSMTDFVTAENCILNAKLHDYAECFQRCLETQRDDEAEGEDGKNTHSCDLIETKPNVYEFRLSVQVRVFSSTWTAAFSFVLNEVQLEPLDILASIIRDHEEHISALKTQQICFFEKQRQGSLPCLRAMTAANFGKLNKLLWKTEASEAGFSISSTGDITVGITGTYLIYVTVRTLKYSSGNVVELQLNGFTVSSVSDLNPARGEETRLSYVMPMAEGDKFCVVYSGIDYAYSGSSLAVYPL